MKGSKGKKQSSNKGLAAAELALLRLPTTGKFILQIYVFLNFSLYMVYFTRPVIPLNDGVTIGQLIVPRDCGEV